MVRERLGQLREVARHHEERRAVRSQHDRVRPVLAIAVEGAQELDAIQLAVSIRVARAPQAALELARAADDGVERVEGPQEALRLAERDRERRDARLAALSLHLDPEHAAEIVAWVRGFKDVPDRVKVVRLSDIEAQDWTLNVSRYVMPPVGDDIPSLPEAVAAFKQAVAEARAAEDRLRDVLTEGGWLS